MPSFKHYLKPHLIAAGVSLGAVFSPQVTRAQEATQSSIQELMYCQQDIDIASITESYTIQAGDSFSKIASDRGISYADFILVWNYVNPGKDLNDLIRVGDQFFVMKAGQDAIKKLEILKAQIIAKNNFDAANILFEEERFQELELKYGFEISPKQPIGLGIEEKMNHYAREFQADPIAFGPRTVLLIYQELTICANLSRSTTRDSVDLDDPNLPKKFKELLLEQNVDAWYFHDAFTEAGYKSLHDMRDYFGRLQSGVNPIKTQERENYTQALISMMRYLRDFGKADTKIPVFFLHTGAVESIMGYKNGKNPSSHVFSYVGEAIQDPYRADFYSQYDNILPQYRKEFRNGIGVEEYLIDIVQMRSGWGFTNSREYRTIIRENLLTYSEFVGFYINGEKIDIQKEFENPSIFLKAEDMIQLGGSIIYDGVHIKTAVDADLQENMNTRISTLWEMMVVQGYFPAEILEPPSEFLSYGRDIHSELYTQVPVRDTSYLKEGEDVTRHINQLIASNIFGEDSYDRLTPEQMLEAEKEFQRQIKAHILYGNLSLDGSTWTVGSTRVNKAFYLYDTTNIEGVFSNYMREKKRAFYEQISSSCTLGNTQYPDFIQVLIFPEDNTADILNLIEHYLRSKNSSFLGAFMSFDALQKDYFLMKLLGKKISGGDFQAGKSIFLSYAAVESQIETLANMSYIGELSQLSEDNRALFELFSGTQALKELLGFIIVNESYINSSSYNKDTFSNILGLEELSARLGRKGQKELYRYLHENNLLPLLAELLNEYKEIPTKGPSSFGDFQIRFANLYTPDAFVQWPTKGDLGDTIDLILDMESPFQDIIKKTSILFPKQVELDIYRVEQIQAELRKESPDGVRVATLLKELFQTNDTRNMHIIGKIISSSLMIEKLQGHSDRFLEQLSRSGMSIDIENSSQRERYSKSVLFINNVGESDALAILFENYVRRGFLHFQEKYPERGIVLPPESRTSDGIAGGKAFYTREFLETDIEQYINELSKIPEGYFLKAVIENMLIGGIENAEIYEFLKSSDIQSFYSEVGIESSSLLPTETELYSRAIFGYSNENHLKNRIPEPERMLSDFRGPMLAILLSLYILTSTIGGTASIGVKYALSPAFRATGIGLEAMFLLLAVQRRKRKDKKFDTTLEKSYSQKGLDSYIESRKNPQDLVLDGEDTEIYSDGYYKITGKNSKEQRIVYESNLLLTNQEGNPLSQQYSDGYYSFISPMTQIIRKHAISIIIKKQNTLFLSPEQRVYEREKHYAMAAAE